MGKEQRDKKKRNFNRGQCVHHGRQVHKSKDVMTMRDLRVEIRHYQGLP